MFTGLVVAAAPAGATPITFSGGNCTQFPLGPIVCENGTHAFFPGGYACVIGGYVNGANAACGDVWFTVGVHVGSVSFAWPFNGQDQQNSDCTGSFKANQFSCTDPAGGPPPPGVAPTPLPPAIMDWLYNMFPDAVSSSGQIEWGSTPPPQVPSGMQAPPTDTFVSNDCYSGSYDQVCISQMTSGLYYVCWASQTDDEAYCGFSDDVVTVNGDPAPVIDVPSSSGGAGNDTCTQSSGGMTCGDVGAGPGAFTPGTFQNNNDPFLLNRGNDMWQTLLVPPNGWEFDGGGAGGGVCNPACYY